MKRQRKSECLFSQKQRNSRGNHPHSLANLKPFQRGKSGNPSGLPQGVPKVSVALMSLLRGDADADYQPKTRAEQLAWALFQRALNGEVPALREVMDRSEGRSAQTVKIDDNALQVKKAQSEAMLQAANAIVQMAAVAGHKLTVEEALGKIREIQIASAQLT